MFIICVRCPYVQYVHRLARLCAAYAECVYSTHTSSSPTHSGRCVHMRCVQQKRFFLNIYMCAIKTNSLTASCLYRTCRSHNTTAYKYKHPKKARRMHSSSYGGYVNVPRISSIIMCPIGVRWFSLGVTKLDDSLAGFFGYYFISSQTLFMCTVWTTNICRTLVVGLAFFAHQMSCMCTHSALLRTLQIVFGPTKPNERPLESTSNWHCQFRELFLHTFQTMGHSLGRNCRTDTGKWIHVAQSTHRRVKCVRTNNIPNRNIDSSNEWPGASRNAPEMFTLQIVIQFERTKLCSISQVWIQKKSHSECFDEQHWECLNIGIVCGREREREKGAFSWS